MNRKYLRTIAATAIACAAGLCLATPSFANSTVSLDLDVQNGNFESGLTDWTACCGGSPGASTYAPSPVSTYYTSGTIPGGGTSAMFVPTAGGDGWGSIIIKF